MYSMGYNDNLSHCSFWGRSRHENQANGYYTPINQAFSSLATSNPIYQLESMVSQNSSVGFVTARQSQRSYPSCNRYMYNGGGYQEAPQRRDWQWRRHSDEALGELCSWLQATESTLSSRLPTRGEARSSCAVIRPTHKEKKKASLDESKTTKKQSTTPTKKPEKCELVFKWLLVYKMICLLNVCQDNPLVNLSHFVLMWDPAIIR